MPAAFSNYMAFHSYFSCLRLSTLLTEPSGFRQYRLAPISLLFTAFVSFIDLTLNIRFRAGLNSSLTKLFKAYIYIIGDSRSPSRRTVCKILASTNKFLISLADFSVFGSGRVGLTPCGESELVEKATFSTPTFSHVESRFIIGLRLGYMERALYVSRRQKCSP